MGLRMLLGGKVSLERSSGVSCGSRGALGVDVVQIDIVCNV